jgi:abhydrolase domain-containing protein 5
MSFQLSLFGGTDYMFHTLAARASGELCLKYIFSLGAFARSPLLTSAPDWKVPTSFIYGVEDWMDFRGAEEARKRMNVPCEIIRVPQVKLLRRPVYPFLFC